MGLEITDGHSAPKATKKRGEQQGPMTFSRQIIEASNRVEIVKFEAMGLQRSVGVRSPKGGDAMRLSRILSADDAAKPQVFNQCMLAFCISEIDGDPVPKPGTALQIEVILDRLGFEGIAAAAQAFARLSSIDGEDDAKN